MKLPLLLVCALACAFSLALQAQSRADDSAKRITSQPEYKGYRVERRPDSPASDWDPDGVESDDGRTSEGRTTPRRGASPGQSESPGGRSDTGPRGESVSMPAWIGQVFMALAIIVLGVGVLAALFFIVKALLGIRFKKRRKQAKKKTDRDAPAESETDEPEEEIEIDEQVFEDALAIARREYEQAIRDEDFARATLLSYRIFWLQAGWQGCVCDDDKRTWRDALRMVRQIDSRRRVRELLPLVERVRYADYSPDQREFNAWRARVELVDPTAVLK